MLICLDGPFQIPGSWKRAAYYANTIMEVNSAVVFKILWTIVDVVRQFVAQLQTITIYAW